jgi:hypothetical protein
LDTRAQTFDFYRELLQNLKAWQAKAPKLADAEEEELEVPRVDEGVATPTPLAAAPPGIAALARLPRQPDTKDQRGCGDVPCARRLARGHQGRAALKIEVYGQAAKAR